MNSMWYDNLFRLIDWRAPVEIALISFGLYILYRNIRITGAWKMVAGIVTALGLFAVARYLDLAGIEWLLSRFSGVALIALIVVFQPEIRRLYDRAVSFRQRQKHRGEPQVLVLLADVMFELAERQWGGIIVLPGKESLAPWLPSGIVIDAKPSFPLLISIFDPNSPGHDGAVILDEGRLTSFGVRLPLSSQAELPEEYGTRHHAAAGLSEATDAMVLVASEERGQVSAFSRGALTVVESREHLTGLVGRHWDGVAGAEAVRAGQEHKSRFSIPVLSSILVATIFWLAVVPEKGEELEMSFTVPVEYTAVPADLAVAGGRLDSVRLTLSGTTAALSEINPSDIRVRADLSAVVAGTQSIPLSGAVERLPRGVGFIEMDPASLDLRVVRMLPVSLPVRAQLVGEPPDGLQVRGMEVQPNTIPALVAEGATEVPSEILTAPIMLTGIRSGTRIITELVAPAGARPAGESWPDVTVILSVGPAVR